MKNVMKRSFTSILAMAMAISPIVYADTSMNEFGGCEVKTAGFTPGTTVTFSVDGVALGGPINVSGGGVAIRTIGKKDLNANGPTNVVIKSSNGITKGETCAGTTSPSTGGGSTGGTTPSKPTPPVAPVETREPLEQSKIENQAENHARFAANKIRDNYGRAERVRYNFAAGLRHGLRFANRWEQVANYNIGFTTGQSIGISDGQTRGISDGLSAGNTAGRNEAAGRFEAVVDTGRLPESSKPTINASLPLVAAPTLASILLDVRLAQAENEYSDLFGFARGYTEYFRYNAFWGTWSIVRVREYNSALRSYPDAGEAFSIYMDSRNAEMRAYWANHLTNDEKFSNTTKAQSWFQSAFMIEYNRVIADKWEAAVTQRDDAAFARGVAIGEAAVNDVAFAEGRKDGYARGYVLGFNNNYVVSFDRGVTDGFNTVWNHYSSNPVIKGLSASLNNPTGQNLWIPGTPVSVKILSLRNVGLQPSDVKVSLLSSENNVFPWTSKTVTVKSSSSVKDIQLDLLGEISPDVPANGNFVVNVAAGTESQQLVLNSNWWMTVKSLGLTAGKTDEASKRIFDYSKKHILAKLKAEWIENGRKSGYNFGQERSDWKNTLVRELVKIYDNEPTARDGIRTIGWDIVVSVYDNKTLPAFGSPNHVSITQFLKTRLSLK